MSRLIKLSPADERRQGELVQQIATYQAARDEALDVLMETLQGLNRAKVELNNLLRKARAGLGRDVAWPEAQAESAG